jgi:hypothetical protein
MTKIYADSVFGEILPITAHYYFKKMEVFEILSSSKNLIEDVSTLNKAVCFGNKIGFEMGSLEDFRIEYNQVFKTTRQKNNFPFREWLDNKRELMLKEI